MSITNLDELPQLSQALDVIARSRPDLVHALHNLRAAAENGWQRGVRPIRSIVDAGLDIAQLELCIWTLQGFDYMAELPELVSPDLLGRIPPHEAVDLGVFPVGRADDTVTVAVVDPLDTELMTEIRSRFPEYTVEIVVTNRPALEAAANNQEDAELADDFVDEEALARAAQLRAMQDQLTSTGRVAELADVLIELAIMSGASDIHIEPDGDRCQIRFRLDGMLTAAGSHPAAYCQTLVNRIKIMAQLDVGDRRTPQDGRATAIYGGRTVDLRVVTIPSAWGPESCVIRLLDQSRVRARFSALGFSRHNTAQFDKLLSLQGGVVLATGPTGSGKTTTLYSALQQMTTPAIKTITVEDPVEYRLPGMLQVQVNRAAEFDFATALRAILRADPDVLLVGEVRDAETARTALGAALTGQVVLASLHAVSAAAAPIRLIDLGIERFMVAAAVRGVINQRLLRRLCRRCRVPYAPRRSQLDDAGWPFARPERLWGARAGGCDACNGTGYRGRAVVAEVIAMDDVLRAAIIDNADPSEIEAIAIRQGMVPIRHDALQLARQGATSLEEISRVIGTR
ncbi:unannotated protein [freshwater metagenome]|uniref:Unannotated protein n=1 Tax=freshwater metagenome TaxID=449393 RepID=A0A6J7FLQ5_9ZZZZ|nr:type II secretion system protein GspE [Actinomycetota bacterium]